MKRAKDSQPWKNFLFRLNEQNFEMFPRMGDPIPVHKRDTPLTIENVGFVWFRRKSGKLTKTQMKGLTFYKALGFKVYVLNAAGERVGEGD